MILPFFRKFRKVFAECENVSQVVRHFYYIELAFLGRLTHFEFFLKNGVRTFRADMFFAFFALSETKLRQKRKIPDGCLGFVCFMIGFKLWLSFGGFRHIL